MKRQILQEDQAPQVAGDINPVVLFFAAILLIATSPIWIIPYILIKAFGGR